MLWAECNNKSTIRITEADGHSIWSDAVVAETEAVHPVVIRTYCVEARGNGEGQEGNHLGDKGTRDIHGVLGNTRGITGICGWFK